MNNIFQKDKARNPSAAGTFYPENQEDLRTLVTDLLGEPSSLDNRPIKALIVPHAGYVYSGQTAAMAFSEIRDGSWKRIVVISPSHREAFQGISAFPGEAYLTPLGRIEVDRNFCEQLVEQCGIIHFSEKGHRISNGAGMGEHALEVQLPFLQCALDEFTLVPLVMGQQDMNTAAALGLALADLCADGKTLIVASSDLSHFHTYDEARKMDLKLVDTIRRFDYFSLSSLIDYGEVEACGSGPAIAAMIASENIGAGECEILDYRNSGDAEFGSRDQVVGYVSAAMLDGKKNTDSNDAEISDLSVDEKNFLLDLSRTSVESAVKNQANPLLEEKIPDRLQQNAAVFVTLTVDGNLRGCIGSILPEEKLCQAVASSAVNASLHDPRFSPVTEKELPELSYEISVLSRFRLVADIEDIVIGRHGLWVQSGSSRGLLLPQVASEYSWDRQTFLEQTCLKASLQPDAWMDSVADLFYFSASVFNDQ